MTTKEWIPIEPHVLAHAQARLLVRRVVRRLARAGMPSTDVLSIPRIRDEEVALADKLDAGWAAETVLVVYVLCDLRAQGWLFRIDRDGLAAMPPLSNMLPVTQEKHRIRAAHLIGRDAQLRRRSTRRFIEKMERRQPHSIFSLMRDGRQLASLATQYAEFPLADRANALRGLIDPYVQPVRAGAVCEHTCLALSDIWRYFRYTWTTAYQSTPGRKMFFLIRDRAAPNHPVIGIGALGSSVVQLSVRDEWIGWTGSQLLATMRAHPTAAWAQWLDRSLRNLINNVFITDFILRGDICSADIDCPTIEVTARLIDLSKRERSLHTPRVSSKPIDWRGQVETHLFRSKRAKALADLLGARRHLQSAGFHRPVAADLQKALISKWGARAIETVLRGIKAANVGIHMMDITVCGAIAPYNHLIGGKLVALLMASHVVVDAYNRRYRHAQSVIASAVAGRAVRRTPHLVLLGTTSLYGAGASQYNRLRMPAAVAGGRPGTVLQFKKLGKTVGYGSYHFSSATMQSIDLVLLRHGRSAPNMFGEGVNPKLRKVRAALDVVGLPSDLLLQHGNQRIVYGVPVASNFQDVLLGRSDTPDYILPNTLIATERIADFWRERWLARRIENPDVINRVAAHTSMDPIAHGARVNLPGIPGELELGQLNAETASNG